MDLWRWTKPQHWERLYSFNQIIMQDLHITQWLQKILHGEKWKYFKNAKWMYTCIQIPKSVFSVIIFSALIIGSNAALLPFFFPIILNIFPSRIKRQKKNTWNAKPFHFSDVKPRKNKCFWPIFSSVHSGFQWGTILFAVTFAIYHIIYGFSPVSTWTKT